ncbi:unnamed protein product [Spirodela intermedia]|uniref:Uncharacterized protein n=1 Tax=Spirodela intermedia TaxID=51605 RepID=A0A7I8KML9_SPIIN|nr:unnamed protein product [Spirodela intermedia]
MCPLRLILIFLSATLAGFFVLRGLNSRAAEDGGEAAAEGSAAGGTLPEEEETLCGKIRSAMRSGFWTFVDMASGRYLWRSFVPEKRC